MEARVLTLEGLARQMLEGLGRLEAGQRGLEAGQVKIEANMGRLEAGQRKMELDVAELKGRVSQLPTAIQLLGFILAVLVISGLVRVFAP